MARRSQRKTSTKNNKKGDSDQESSVGSKVHEEELNPAQTASNASESSPDDMAGEGDASDQDELELDVKLDPKQKAAISLKIRRKLEERDESRRLRADLDYLEEDFDDE